MPSSRLAAVARAVLAVSVVTGLLASPGCAEAEVSFTHTNDPEKVVLFIQSERLSAGVRTTMALNGDGRVELARHVPSEGTSERRALQLSREEMDLLLRQVVEDGLAEFDPITIRAREIQKNGGYRPRSSSGPKVTVLISLESFRRGERDIGRVQKKIEFMSPDLAAERFPEIVEYRGLVRLLGYMSAAFERAEESSE